MSVSGNVEMGAPRELEELLAGLLGEGVTRLVVDLSERPVPELEAARHAGAHLRADRTRATGGVAVLTSQTYVKHMLEVTEDGGVLLLEDSREAALAALGLAAAES